MKSLTRRTSTADLNIYGDLDDAMDVEVDAVHFIATGMMVLNSIDG
jgi:hypothetical protein